MSIFKVTLNAKEPRSVYVDTVYSGELAHRKGVQTGNEIVFGLNDAPRGDEPCQIMAHQYHRFNNAAVCCPLEFQVRRKVGNRPKLTNRLRPPPTLKDVSEVRRQMREVYVAKIGALSDLQNDKESAREAAKENAIPSTESVPAPHPKPR